VHTKELHSLLMMKTVTLAMQAEHVTNRTTPKGKLSIALLVKEELAQFYFKTTHRLVCFIFGGREFQTDDPENAKLVLYRSTRVRGNTYLFDPYRAGALFRRSHTY